jgi:hypothetical protein
MPRKKHTVEEIIGKLREVEVQLGQGRSASEAVRAICELAPNYDPFRLPIGTPVGNQIRKSKQGVVEQ